MGLDMYLTKKMYVKNWNHTPQDKRSKVVATVGNKKIDTSKIVNLEFESAYWRKANAIHEWFVKNVQDGNDDCKEYYVDVSQLEELKTLCEHILHNHKRGDKKLVETFCKELMPTSEGFFFGSTDYDDYFFDCLKQTVEQLDNLDQSGDYYYQSSW
tara:strand:+ start:181 stop:648 length:468 start_codon:yes stop_codon:yes gene_type:complete